MASINWNERISWGVSNTALYRLSDTKSLFSYNTGGVDGWGFAIATVSGTSLSIGDTYYLGARNNVVVLDENRFLLMSTTNNFYVCNISGNVITKGALQQYSGTITQETPSLTSYLILLDTDKVVVDYHLAGPLLGVLVMTISGDTITFGTMVTKAKPYGSDQGTYSNLTKLTSTKILYNQGGSAYAQTIINVSGLVPTIIDMTRTEYNFENTICRISDTQLIWYFKGSSGAPNYNILQYMKVITVSGNTISYSTRQLVSITAGDVWTYSFLYDDNIVFLSANAGGGNNRSYQSLITYNGSTLSIANVSSYYFYISSGPPALLSKNTFIGTWYDERVPTGVIEWGEIITGGFKFNHLKYSKWNNRVISKWNTLDTSTGI